MLEDSKGICAISGSPSIKINDHGQTAELTQQNIDNADNDILVEFLPFVNLKKVIRDSDQLDN